MKNRIKSITAIFLIALTIALSACSNIGLIKSETSPGGTHAAHLYSRKTEAGIEYCISLLENDVALDMEAEPNVYKSEDEIDFEWSDDMLMVVVDFEDMPAQNVIQMGDIMVVFGQMAGKEE